MIIKAPGQISYWLVLCGTFDDGLKIIDLDNNHLIYHKIYKDEDLLAIDYIKSINKLVVGAGDGKLRLIDVAKITQAVKSKSFSINEDPE